MYKKLTQKLEDPKHPLLGPCIKSLHFWGIILPKKTYKKLAAYLMHVSLLVFACTVCIDMWFLKSDFDLLLKSVRYNLLTFINCVKIVTFLVWQNKWIDILEYVTRADISSRNNQDAREAKIINGYTNYCRKVTYIYWCLTLCTVLAVIFQPVVKYFLSPTYRENVRNGTELFDQVLSHNAPFDYNHVGAVYHVCPLGASCLHYTDRFIVDDNATVDVIEYILALVYTSWCTIYAGGLINSFDTTAIVIMVFFKGELQLLKKACTKIFDADDKETVSRSLRECQQRHVELVKYAALFNSCLSPIMFLYMIVSSFTLCASVYQITIETSPMQRLLTAEYAIFGVAQLFFYCWHGNDVLYMSHEPMRGVYHSDWWKRNIFRKEILLLTGQLDKRIILTAGPFITLTLAAFVTILKGAYSYYTLINK